MLRSVTVASKQPPSAMVRYRKAVVPRSVPWGIGLTGESALTNCFSKRVIFILFASRLSRESTAAGVFRWRVPTYDPEHDCQELR